MKGFLLACASALVLAAPAHADYLYQLTGTATVWTPDGFGNPIIQTRLFDLSFGLASDDPLCDPEYCIANSHGAHFWYEDMFGYLGFVMTFDGPLTESPPTNPSRFVSASYEEWFGQYIVISNRLRLVSITEGDNYGGSWPGYSLGAVVPEPSTWAMMIGGFALVGAAMRRRYSVAFA